MTATAPRTRAPTASRRLGYLVAVAVNGVLVYLLNVSPGWQAVPFLTDETPQVLGVVNASLLAGVVANLIYLVRDPRWLRAVGDLVTTAIGLAAMVRIWQVFPLQFEEQGVPWETIARVLLAIGIVGSAIAIVAALVTLASPS
ncbi:MAG TPA: hypothetical protein VH915_14125, partial [Pedococcus sp.]